MTHVEALRECAQTCSQTLAYCVSEGGEHVEESHLRALIDCAEICGVAANFVGRESELKETLMEACAEACERCADTCEGFDDETMAACAEACRRCAEACEAA